MNAGPGAVATVVDKVVELCLAAQPPAASPEPPMQPRVVAFAEDREVGLRSRQLAQKSESKIAAVN